MPVKNIRTRAAHVQGRRTKAKHNKRQITWGGVRGYLYPSGGSSLSKRMTTFSASHTGDVNDLPVLNISKHFYNPNSRPPIAASITYNEGRTRYLVTGFYDGCLDVNPSLYALDPNIQWRGAIAIVSMGTRSALLSRPKGTQLFIRESVRIFMKRITEARTSGKDYPQYITYANPM